MDFQHPFRVITPTLDGEALAVLARAESNLSARAVHRLLGRASEAGVRRVLQRLRVEGIVLAEPAGRAILYRLNRDHLASRCVEELANPRRLLVHILAEFLGELHPKPVYVAIFGSVARGEASPDSDLDLLVVRPQGIDEDDAAWREAIGKLQQFATLVTGNHCHPLEYSQEEFVGRVRDAPVLKQAQREGLTVLGSAEAMLQRVTSSGL